MGRLWRDHVEQVGDMDLDGLVATTRPSVLLLVLGVSAAANLTMRFVPAARAATGYHHPLVPIALMAAGMFASHLLHRAAVAGAHERMAFLSVCDTTLIATSVLSMSLCAAAHPADYVLAVLYAAAAIVWGVQQGFSWPMFGAVAVWPTLLSAAFAGRDPLNVILVAMSFPLYTIPAVVQRKKNRTRREAEEATRDGLEEAARLATLGRVGASLAHEMNQPLVAIRGFAQRLMRKGLEGSPDELESIAVASSHLARLVEQVRLLGAPQP